MEVVGAHGGTGAEAGIFARYGPPFDLTSDMLLALALCSTAPLREAFPSMPFLSLLGRTPLVIWFSRITEGWCRDTAGGRRQVNEGIPYAELNVLALLRAPALFVPGIYATSELSVGIGHGYGMPKQLIAMDFSVSRARITSSAGGVAGRSSVRGRLDGSGKALAGLLGPLWPLRTWPVYFPSGSYVRALVQSIRRVQLARIEHGQLSVAATWMPETVSLLPVGLYLSDLQLRLPPPHTPG